MEEGNPLAALATTGSVGSRFVTQSEIDSAKEQREEDWKAAYARYDDSQRTLQPVAENIIDWDKNLHHDLQRMQSTMADHFMR
jgi:hypothetical protein